MSGPPLLPHQTNGRVALVLFVGSCVAVLTLRQFLSSSLFPPCLFHTLTGLPCPFCGGTRATNALLHGDWQQSLYLNPLALIAILAFGLATLIAVIELFLKRTLVDWTALSQPWKKALPLFLAALGLWWAYHLFSTLRTPKNELLDLRKPVARAAYDRVHGH